MIDSIVEYESWLLSSPQTVQLKSVLFVVERNQFDNPVYAYQGSSKFDDGTTTLLNNFQFRNNFGKNINTEKTKLGSCTDDEDDCKGMLLLTFSKRTRVPQRINLPKSMPWLIIDQRFSQAPTACSMTWKIETRTWATRTWTCTTASTRRTARRSSTCTTRSSRTTNPSTTSWLSRDRSAGTSSHSRANGWPMATCRSRATIRDPAR